MTAADKPIRAPTPNRTLWWGYLAIALAPVLVFLFAQGLLEAYDPEIDPPARLAEFDVYREGAARLGTLAALLLFIAAALGAVILFFRLCGASTGEALGGSPWLSWCSLHLVFASWKTAPAMRAIK